MFASQWLSFYFLLLLGEQEGGNYEEYYYGEAEYRGEGTEGAQAETGGEWRGDEYVGALTEEEQQVWYDAQYPAQEGEGNPQENWGYDEGYQDDQQTEYADTGEQEAQYGQEEWIDPATGYAYEDPQVYAATEEGYGEEGGYYEDHQWQYGEETGIAPEQAAQEYYGDGTTELESFQEEQYEGHHGERAGYGEVGYMNQEENENPETEDTKENAAEQSDGDEPDDRSPSPARSPERVHVPVVEPNKPLKSILKKSKPRSEINRSTTGTATSTLSQAASVFSEEPKDGMGSEFIVKLTGERAAFYCKLCQCHFNTITAKNLHLKGMKHIQLFIHSKSKLLSSVIAETKTEKPPGKRDAHDEPFYLPPKFPRHR